MNEERQVDVDQRVRNREALPAELDRAVAVDDPRVAPQELGVRLQKLVLRNRVPPGRNCIMSTT
jgi:hypothetical protein